MSAAAVALLATALASATMAPAWGAAKPPRPSFVQPGSYRAEPVNTPLGFAVADFDGDTHLDLASAGVFSANPQSTTPRGVPVQPGDGAGHLGETTLTLLPSKTGLEAPIAIDTADLDADGDPDIVVSTLDLVFDGTQTVVVYRMRVLDNQGGGSFTVLKGFRLPSEVDHLVLADLTGDGTTDLAYATDAPEGSTLWTAKGRGDSTFAWPVAITETEQLTISTLEAADVDNDQSPDLVYGKGCVVAQLNNGDGTFGNPICNPLRNYPQTVAVADLDGDSNLDVALGDASGGHVRVALGDGAGHFVSRHVYHPIASQVLSVVATDVDDDGIADLVASGDAAPSTQTSIAVLRGTGGGSFRLASRWVSGGAHLTVGDFTEDGLPDLVADDAGLHQAALLTINAGNGHFRAPQLTVAPAKRTAGQLARDVLSADVDHDGRPDVLLIAATAVIVYLNQGGGEFVRWASPEISYSSGTILSAALGDLNGDGNLDLAIGGFSTDNVTVLLSTGNGTFAKPATYNNGSGAAALSIAIGDVTGDGRPDVVSNTFTSLSVMSGKSNGTLGAPKLTGSAQANQTVLHLTDLDGDGDLDAVGAAKTGNPDNASTQVISQLNNGTGTFGNVVTKTLPTNLTDGIVAELTGDGKTDLAISGSRGTHTGLSGIFVLPGTATGLGTAIVAELADIPGSLAAADYNADGTVDLAATTSADTQVFSNPGNGQFPSRSTTSVLTPSGGAAVISARFTNDNRPDLATFISSNPPEFALAVNNTR